MQINHFCEWCLTKEENLKKPQELRAYPITGDSANKKNQLLCTMCYELRKIIREDFSK